MNIAIITGASSGLGREFFRSVVRRHTDLDEIWLVARREERLKEIAAEASDVKTRCVPLDLTAEGSIDEMDRLIEEAGADVRVFVNNAGFGTLGDFIEAVRASQALMIELNVRVMTEMASVVLHHMSRGGYIVNVSSIASFVPNARMAVYSSTKAYVTSFSKALRFELKDRGINCLAVCPGPMKTEFLAVAGINGNSKAFETLPYSDPAVVADKAIKHAKAGRGIYTPHPFFKLYRVLAKLVPDAIMMHAAKT